jgi:hypothetical protein
MTVTIPIDPSFFEGVDAGVLRSAGMEVNPDVPDCAVLKLDKDSHPFFEWVTVSGVVKLNEGGL